MKTKPYVTQPQPLGLKVDLHTHKWTEWLDEPKGTVNIKSLPVYPAAWMCGQDKE